MTTRRLVTLSLAWASLFAFGCTGSAASSAQDSESDSTATSRRTGRFPKGRSSRGSGATGGGAAGKFQPPDEPDCGRTGIGGGPLYYCPGDEEAEAVEQELIRRRSSYRLPDLNAEERAGS